MKNQTREETINEVSEFIQPRECCYLEDYTEEALYTVCVTDKGELCQPDHKDCDECFTWRWAYFDELDMNAENMEQIYEREDLSDPDFREMCEYFADEVMEYRNVLNTVSK